ncbi:hypothetical protein BV20DRAFT_1033714 [Pilatotrama ljubarskyi]|nr:hypothetical protein BV20DRAFT_1033714 [Pilatotrama ljubarskyi]
MHNLFLGALKHHCMEVFGVDIAGEKQSKKHVISHTPDEQQGILDRISTQLRACSENGLMRFRKDYVSAVARHNNVIESKARLSKRDICRALVAWVRTLGENLTAISLPPPLLEPTSNFCLPSENDVVKFSVFTNDVLQRLREDIASTILPSWLEKPPSNFGSAGHGKLKADGWRTVCSVHMVLTLVRLWGSSGSSAEERLVLENFIHLINAVDIATRRSMSRARMDTYDRNMEEYLKGLRHLFDHPLVPNHHLALHLRQCLELFGPVHGWWAYPFERYNGLLQRMNTNHKPAEIPKTFIRYFYIGARLRSLVRTIEWPDAPVYKRWLTTYATAFGDVVRGTRVTDMLSFDDQSGGVPHAYDQRKETSLSGDIYEQLYSLIDLGSKNVFKAAHDLVIDGRPRLSDRAELVDSITHGGVRYATAQRSAHDSNIIFTIAGQDADETTYAGQIHSIFHHRRREHDDIVVEPFVVIRRLKPLSASDAQHDPYRAFPDLETRMYYDRHEDAVILLRPSAIVAHFASLKYTPDDIGQACIVARSLNRVRGQSKYHSSLSDWMGLQE